MDNHLILVSHMADGTVVVADMPLVLENLEMAVVAELIFVFLVLYILVLSLLAAAGQHGKHNTGKSRVRAFTHSRPERRGQRLGADRRRSARADASRIVPRGNGADGARNFIAPEKRAAGGYRGK